MKAKCGAILGTRHCVRDEHPFTEWSPHADENDVRYYPNGDISIRIERGQHTASAGFFLRKKEGKLICSIIADDDHYGGKAELTDKEAEALLFMLTSEELAPPDSDPFPDPGFGDTTPAFIDLPTWKPPKDKPQ